jgi:hypothetical protein
VLAVRRPIAKLCLVFGCLLLACSALCAWKSYSWSRRLDQIVDPVFVFPISTDNIEEQAVLFENTCEVVHSQSLTLWVYDSLDQPVHSFSRIPKIECRLEFLGDPKSSRMLNIRTPEVADPAFDPAGGMIFYSGHYGPVGLYRLVFKLQEPIDCGGAARAEIVANNRLCGLERLPADVARVIALVAGAMGLCLVAVFAGASRSPELLAGSVSPP